METPKSSSLHFKSKKDSYDTAKAYEAFRPDVRELKRPGFAGEASN